ncbi:hypothetical protein LOTGIDRAFT_130892 [Lottia gigantea]|uniref:Ciliogenesis and planar polarity effector 2 n=1 Tax=Lottia gigantea TaxID=225164 RepID=V3Z3I8_LOTGI|nr:hypothetical protein LOTGIDRAFT_130892 [Lottia gigantea]ESO85193.1 hypothetical protein LOTGIDRAFT_130892 [Lottia gigantea]
MCQPGLFIQPEWYHSREATELITSYLLKRDGVTRKTFGILEKPSFPSTIEEISYKLFIVGKSSVGKTSTVCKLTGYPIPTLHSETPGVQVSTVYWPARITGLNRIIMFKLQLWDAGENSLKKFDHILNACTEKTDGILFVFSIVDKGSFDEIPQFLTKLTNPGDNLCKIVLGTKFDLHAESEVTQRNIKDFESTWHIPVLRIKNVLNYNQSDPQSDLYELTPILTTICEQLWHRDIISAQNRNRNQEKAFF